MMMPLCRRKTPMRRHCRRCRRHAELTTRARRDGRLFAPLYAAFSIFFADFSIFMLMMRAPR